MAERHWRTCPTRARRRVVLSRRYFLYAHAIPAASSVCTIISSADASSKHTLTARVRCRLAARYLRGKGLHPAGFNPAASHRLQRRPDLRHNCPRYPLRHAFGIEALQEQRTSRIIPVCRQRRVQARGRLVDVGCPQCANPGKQLAVDVHCRGNERRPVPSGT